MVYNHIGNNVYFGDNRDEIPISQNAVHFNINTGDISRYYNGQWNTTSFGGRTDQLFASILRQLTLTNIGTSYVDVFPAFYNGFPIPIDTNGFSKLGIVLLWNKNGGTGRHDVRLINNTINTGTSTFTLRKNGVDTALSVSIPAGNNGTFTDTTDTVTVGPNDDICYKFTISGSTGTLGLTWASLVAEGVADSGPVDMNVTDTIVLTNKFITKV